MHYSLEKLLEACGPHLRLLHLDYVCQLPFADLLLTIVSRHCPHLKDFKVASTNFFASDAGVRPCLHVFDFMFLILVVVRSEVGRAGGRVWDGLTYDLLPFFEVVETGGRDRWRVQIGTESHLYSCEGKRINT